MFNCLAWVFPFFSYKVVTQMFSYVCTLTNSQWHFSTVYDKKFKLKLSISFSNSICVVNCTSWCCQPTQYEFQIFQKLLSFFWIFDDTRVKIHRFTMEIYSKFAEAFQVKDVMLFKTIFFQVFVKYCLWSTKKFYN